ncbi:hypothetical protein GIV17_19795 [Pseudomonas syringae]|nr:hypothetical protein [Pseudomonas syringae]MCF5742274.1 hypothetical protein [Pseudomonas syringae]MCF5751572.1 hypothetical protein [Pseudomonas syringae]MCF5758146.1 hypothetical protein [Pseudomonas syringae]
MSALSPTTKQNTYPQRCRPIVQKTLEPIEDKAGLVFKAEGGDDYNRAEAWIAVDPDAQ